MRRIGRKDVSILESESPRNPHHCGVVIICAADSAGRTPTFGVVVAAVDARLPEAPAARQRLLDAPLGLDNPYWVDDLDFDVEFHVRPPTLPAPGDWGALCDRISRVMSRPLDLRRPPWELM